MRNVGQIGSAWLLVGAAAVAGCSDSNGESAEVLPPVPIALDETASGVAGADDQTVLASQYEFSIAADLALPDDDYGYVYFARREVDPAQVELLAAVFGLDTDQVADWDRLADTDHAPEQDPQSPSTSTDDHPTVATTLGFSAADPMQTWTFASNVDLDALATCDTVQPSDTTSATDALCAASGTDNTDVPDRPSAVSATQSLLSQLGYDAESLQFESYADDYAATVTVAERAVDGGLTGRQWTFTFGAGGAVLFASGPLATGDRVGPYNLVDLDTAVQRLAAWQDSMMPGIQTPELQEAVGIDNLIQVDIVTVAADTTTLFDDAGNAWQVPAYRFIDSDGGRWVVPAIDDDTLNAPESMSSGTAAPDTANEPAATGG